MIHSMTGFGRAEVERNDRVLVAEIRSVNHRFLELSVRLPRSLQDFESKLRKVIQARLQRGKINFSISWKGTEQEGVELSVDMGLAQRYVDILQNLRNEFEFREPITLGQVLALPDLFKWSEPELPPEVAWEFLSEVSEKALGDLVEMRASEGEALARDLLARTDSLRSSIQAVQSRSPERAQEAKERLHSRVTELLAGEAKVDEDRLLIEAAFQAERMECTEECVRLGSHIDQFEQMMTQGGSVGRKLNFLLQEMNREANTIGAKANDVTIAREVIQLKEEIEIIREQIQNIE